MASFYNNYYRYYRPYPPHANKYYPVEEESSHENISSPNITSEKEEKSSRSYSFGPINFKNPFFNDIEEPIFEILGIQLYLDDIIILGLLFFLYQEGVQDEMLFIALILLLLG